MAHAGETDHHVGSEETKGVPTIPPRVSRPLIGIDDEERDVLPGEVVADRQAGLSATDDEGVDVLSSAIHVNASCNGPLISVRSEIAGYFLMKARICTNAETAQPGMNPI
jgi:hypothetical protein